MKRKGSKTAPSVVVDLNGNRLDVQPWREIARAGRALDDAVASKKIASLSAELEEMGFKKSVLVSAYEGEAVRVRESMESERKRNP